MELAGLVSYGDMTPASQLSRWRINQIAERKGVAFPPNATKDMVIKLLEAAGIDILREAEGVRWQNVQPDGRTQAAAARMGENTGFIAPIVPEHETAREGFDSSVALAQRITVTEEKNHAQADEIRSLRQQNEKLVDLIERLEKKLAEQPEQPEPPVESRGTDVPRGTKRKGGGIPAIREYWDLYYKAEAKGLKVRSGMKKAAILELLAEG